MRTARSLILGGCLVALVLAGAAAQTRNARRDRGEEADAAAVAKAIAGSAKALSDFPRTRNVQAVLAFYAQGFIGFENGEETSLDDQRQLLADLASRMEKGIPVELSSRAQNIRVRVAGSVAWATYDYTFQIALGDDDGGEEQGKCTSVLEKKGSSWLLEHEHCSSQCPDDEYEDDEDDESAAQDKT